MTRLEARFNVFFTFAIWRTRRELMVQGKGATHNILLRQFRLYWAKLPPPRKRYKCVTDKKRLQAQQAESMIAALPITSLQIYTDGSAIPNPGFAGSGVFAVRNKVPIFSLAEGIGTMETNNTGEYFAIGLGLHKAESIMQELDFPVTRIDVLSDSRIAINGIEGIWTIRSRLHRRLAYQAQIPLKKLRQVAEVFFHWIPAHVDIVGNENADFNAKTGGQRSRQGVSINMQTFTWDSID
jgi:ribonuclease HI